MKFLRKKLDEAAPLFEEGGKLHKYHAFYEAPDTLLYTPGEVTKAGAHVRDAIDLKRMMVTVVMAMIPAVFFAMWNTGHQALQAVGQAPAAWWNDDFNTQIFQWVVQTTGGHADLTTVDAAALSQDWSWCFLYGAIYFIPVWVTTFVVGGHLEMAFAVIRKHEVNEGFLVTGFLFPMILPPTIPLWQVAIGIAFGVVVGKELFGGTGMNILNPALTGRAFLFFAYPAQISGDQVWTAARSVDGWSGATWLAKAANPALVVDTGDPTGKAVGNAVEYSQESLTVVQDLGKQAVPFGEGGTLEFMDAFIGVVPGSMGETSVLCCLIGAVILIVSRVGSWHTMAGVALGTIGMSMLLNMVGSDTNPLFDMPFYWHMVLGGWAFGTVFMATDPVSSAFTERGKLFYGLGIGIMVVLVRVVNPAYPEGMMLAILFMNLFAPLFDYFAIQSNIKRREARYAA